MLETRHAHTCTIPPEHVAAELQPAAGASPCKWQGVAGHLDVAAGGVTARRAASGDDGPFERFRPFEGHLAFYAGLMEACRVGELPVEPQPSGLSGGWITPDMARSASQSSAEVPGKARVRRAGPRWESAPARSGGAPTQT